MAKIALALLLAPAAAFVQTPAAAPATTALRADAKSMDGIQAPVGFFDPLGLADKASDETLNWCRGGVDVFRLGGPISAIAAAADYPRRGRGAAATRQRNLRAAKVRRRGSGASQR